jgi:hypothetical protein
MRTHDERVQLRDAARAKSRRPRQLANIDLNLADV